MLEFLIPEERNMTNMQKKRIVYVDYLRGIGIVLMMMAHIGFGKQFDHFIHAFHMPLFFFVSGYFFKVNTAKQFFIRKTKALLIPYVVCALVIYGLWQTIFNLPKDSLIHVLVYMNSTDFVAAALWFLPALYIANILYWILRRTLYLEWLITIIVVMIALMGNLYHALIPGPCPFAIDSAAVGVGIIHVGYMYRNNKARVWDYLRPTNRYILLVWSIVTAILIMVNRSVNMRLGYYGIIPLFWVCALSACMILWQLAKYLEIAASKHESLNLVTSCIERTGRHSLFFLCGNQVAIFLCFHAWPVSDNISSIIHNLLVLAIVFMLLYAIALAWESISSRDR